MIKFFRQIRKNLLTENKPALPAGRFSKYLLYAIGEIVLVVIGILIALSINNWNEERKTTNIVKGIYAIVKNDLVADIKTIDWVLKGTKQRDSVFKAVINREITYNDYVACGSCASILSGFPDIKLKSRGLTLLEENSAFLNSNQDSLSLTIIDFYDFYTTEIDVAIAEVAKDYHENRSYFKTNMPWFADYDTRQFNEDLTNYALTSIDYRNRIVSFHNLYYKGYLDYLKDYKEEALVLSKAIDKKIN